MGCNSAEAAFDQVQWAANGGIVDPRIPACTEMPPTLGQQLGTGIQGMDLADASESLIGGAFHAGDWALHHGGQLLLDGAGFIPGVNVLTEGIQSSYHAAHMGWDLHEGDTESAKMEGGEAAWHAGLMALNFATGEGGAAANVARGAHAVEGVAEGTQAVKTLGEGAQLARTGAEGVEAASHAAPAVAHAAEAGEAASHAVPAVAHAAEVGHGAHAAHNLGLHAAHLLADTSEAAWDLTATLYQRMSGDNEKLPFFGGIAPWIAGGAGRNEHEEHGTPTPAPGKKHG